MPRGSSAGTRPASSKPGPAGSIRTGGVDPDRVAAWRTGRDRAVDDLDRLEDADADETVQIARLYAARLKELTES
ncbi:hypothetical protein ACFCV8_29285 [Streptomyces sp. NPDC056347]|uniref:hypothetical protein n=1 Tax=Streptomyces sp. NPDC056347 TaxID=3345790 RepID=UPI0035D54B60